MSDDVRDPDSNPSRRGRRLTDSAASARDARVWELYELGRTIRQIADELGCSPAMVLKIVSPAVAKWNVEDVAQRVAHRKCAVLERGVSELVAAWLRSKAPRELGGPERPGHLPYLVEARRYLAELSRLVGADAPERSQVEATVSRGVDLSGATDEQLDALIAMGGRLPAPGPAESGGAGGANREGPA